MNNINEKIRFIEILPLTELNFLYNEEFGTYHTTIHNAKILNDANYLIIFDDKLYLDLCGERNVPIVDVNEKFSLCVNQALGNVTLLKDFFKLPIISKYSKSNYPFFIMYNYSDKGLDVLIEFNKRMGKDYTPIHKLQIYRILLD